MLKGTSTVWIGGKDGDYLKVLPIDITNLVGAYSRLIKLLEEHGGSDKRKSVVFIT
ncbi:MULTISPECIES: hypothetical protein [Cytobacillus]|uniref:hypothetical protein n=1 Tax=Cytobacillus TaxID=2675230 RepID=UPI0020400B19|nr:hypothetical protein [Cytobacillus firmus]MCM3707346.1 hypothetical protein [Cytobacillus firmus]